MTRTVVVLLLALLAVQAALARPRHRHRRHIHRQKRSVDLSDVERIYSHKSAVYKNGLMCAYGCRCEHKGKSISSLNCDHLHAGSMPTFVKPMAQKISKLSLNDMSLIDDNLQGLVNYTNLVTLSLSDNFLDNIPANAFHHMKQLENLDIHNSTVLTLPVGIFSSLGTLISLNLSRNEISSIRDETFSHFVSLQILDLSRNMIRRVRKSLFQSMAELRVLNLARNEIDLLTSDVFNDLIDLEYLDLGHNYLQAVPFGIFDKLTSLKKINLGGTQMFDLNWQMCSVAKYAKANKGKVHVVVHKDTYKFFMKEKPCEQRCAYVWPCPKFYVCKGTIGNPKCMPHREDEA